MDKFTRWKETFARMYEDGLTYNQICSKLNICLLSAYEWRKKLGLPPRQERVGPVSWMDEKTIQGRSPQEILKKIARPLGLSSGDIKLILVRFGKLRSRGKAQGRSQIELILTAAYLYVRWYPSGKQPVSPHDFLTICRRGGFQISRSALLMHCRLYHDANLFPRDHLKPQQFLERRWNSIKAKRGLSEEVRARALEIMSRSKWGGRTPEAASAGCLYVAARLVSQPITQDELAEEFGITEATLRNVVKSIERDFRI